ncbi:MULTISPECIES: hypothetical protein [Cupriavidus]|jgi:hypothetical protein|uniref:Pilus assembly protein n=1 Tax=Cupriavidus pauculus TaxID=82633 RepID=A0A5P2GZB0_9BURK|nr:hypothetical protein [Cupriavidus pauculus]QET00844.1 hypothetical protein FOB72_01520 [Cupriavidus pauculus]
MNSRPIATALTVLGALLTLGLGGCMNTSPVWDAHFGDAVRTVRMMQTLNPNAPYNPDPVTGVDGRAATFAMDRYNQSFRNPPTDTNAYVIGVGGGSVGSP